MKVLMTAIVVMFFKRMMTIMTIMFFKRMMTIMTKTMLMTGILGWVPLDQDQ